MLVRLAYSIAIQIPFDVLLLDEVLAVGDQASRRNASRRSSASRTRARPWCSCQPRPRATSRRFCDRALLLEKGLVRAQGDPEEVIGLYREHVPVG